MELLKRPSHLDFPEESSIVKTIVYDIKNQGQTALLKYAEELDGAKFEDSSDMLVSKHEIDSAYQEVSSEFIEIINKSKERIWNYHAKQKEKSWISFEDDPEIILGQKIQPMERVGVYVPGGRAAYPSSVLMNIIPAQIAGVSEIVMVTPPDANGIIHPHTLVAADIAGVNKIFKVGGAQAIASLAFGIGIIPKVDKITGPGNIYVTLAKKEVYGYVDIDMLAGPSEVVVVADTSADPIYVAADLLSQAEHDPMATAILITNSVELAKNAASQIREQASTLPKFKIVETSLENFGAIIVVDSIKQGIDLANEIAPEHLELAVKDPFEQLPKVKHAGSIFLGHHSPEPVGDYMAGPNHILPTSGSARFFSPLSVDDFVKKSSIISFSREALASMYKDIAQFARSEGLTAHARSVEVRFEKE